MDQSTPQLEHSLPISASRSVQWALRKANDKKRVQLLADRLTPNVILEKDDGSEELGNMISQPVSRVGFDPSGTIDCPWIEYRINSDKRLRWTSTRDEKWREANWGLGRGKKPEQKFGMIDVPRHLSRKIAARMRFRRVVKAAFAHFCSINAPDPDLKQGFVSDVKLQRRAVLTASHGIPRS